MELRQVELRGRGQILAVSEALHDWWLDLDGMALDDAKHELRMPFVKSAWGRRAGRTDVVLVVCGVTSLEVRDPEAVGWYDLSDIVEREGTVTFTFGIPLRLDASVTW